MTRRGTAPPQTQEAPWTFAQEWNAHGWVTDLDGPVHWIEFGDGGDSLEPPVVLVHGLGGSHLNWVLLGPGLASGRRTLAVDLAGFGLSPGLHRDCSVQGNARLLHRFLVDVVGAPAVLVGNSMGGAVSALTAGSHPDAVAGLALVDPALPMPRQYPDALVAGLFLMYAAPGVGELFMKWAETRLTSRQRVERAVRLCFADPARSSESVMAAATALAEHRRSAKGKDQSFLQAARSLMLLLSRPTRYRSLLRGLTVPTMLIHGAADRLVPIAAARAVAGDNPRWDARFLPDVGHTPQLECPQLVTEAIFDWFAQHDLDIR